MLQFIESPITSYSRVVIIEKHSEFGHDESGRVIDMVKPVNIERRYMRVQKGRVFI